MGILLGADPFLLDDRSLFQNVGNVLFPLAVGEMCYVSENGVIMYGVQHSYCARNMDINRHRMPLILKMFPLPI